MEGNRQGVGGRGIVNEVALERAEEESSDIELFLRWPGRALMFVLLGPYPSTQITDQEVKYRFHTLSTETLVIGLTNLVAVLIMRALLMQVAVVFSYNRKEGDRIRDTLPSVFLKLRRDIAWVPVGLIVEREVARHAVQLAVLV